MREWLGYYEDAKAQSIVWPAMMHSNQLKDDDLASGGNDVDNRSCDFALLQAAKTRYDAIIRLRLENDGGVEMKPRDCGGKAIGPFLLEKGNDVQTKCGYRNFSAIVSPLLMEMSDYAFYEGKRYAARFGPGGIVVVFGAIIVLGLNDLLLGYGRSKRPNSISSSKTITRSLEVFKSLFRVSVGRKRMPDRFSLLVLPVIFSWTTPAAAELSVGDKLGSSLRSSTYSDLHHKLKTFLLACTLPMNKTFFTDKDQEVTKPW